MRPPLSTHSLIRYAAAFITALTLGIFAPLPSGLYDSQALATVPTSGTQHLEKALQGFIQRLDKSRQTKMPPLLSNNEDAKVLEELWNVPAMIGSPPYKATDLPVLMDMIQQQAQISKVYVLFSPDPEKKADTEKNSITFQDEISRSSAVMVSLIAAALDAAEDYAATLKPENVKAQTGPLLKLRLSLQQVITGTTLMLRNPELTAHNQALLTQALADNAASIAKAISVQDRAMLITLVQGAKPQLKGNASASADKFIKLMENKDCAGLCALH